MIAKAEFWDGVGGTLKHIGRVQLLQYLVLLEEFPPVKGNGWPGDRPKPWRWIGK